MDRKEKRYYRLLPFLITLNPILFMYKNNIHEVTIESLVTTLPKVFIATCLTYLITFVLLRDNKKAMIATSIGGLYYFSYHVFQLFMDYLYLFFGMFSYFPIMSYRSEAIFNLGLYTVLFFMAAVKVLENADDIRQSLRGVSITFSVFFVFNVLVFMNIVAIGYREVSIRMLSSDYSHLPITRVSEDIDVDYPDIYYFIPDRYARQDILLRDYNFDNSSFIRDLEERSFNVLSESFSNYPKTYLSVASTLNGQYVQDILPPDVRKSQDQTFVYDILRDSWFLRLVKEHGYVTYHAGAWWNPTRVNRFADVNVNLYASSNEFYDLTFATTVNKPLKGALSGTDYTPLALNYKEPHGYDNLMYQKKFIENLARSEEKTFITTHLLSIHEPYIFDDECVPGGKAYTEDYDVYIRQLDCTNKVFIEMIDTILEHSVDPVVIVVQADEGPITYSMIEKNWMDNSHEQLQQHMRIMSAIYSDVHIPVYESMSSVNMFRLIAREIFNTKTDPLSDISYVYTSQDKPFEFTDVTDIVSGESNLTTQNQ